MLRCVDCSSSYALSEVRFACACGGLLDVVHDLDAVREQVTPQLFDNRLGSKSDVDRSGVWRFRELVFSMGAGIAVTAPEGNTNLYASERICQWTGLEGLRLKHEGENPTGSFKDRGMTVGMTHARMVGATTVACASTGNTSSSLAAYAARGGMRGLVFIPGGEAVSLGKLSQALAYGAVTARIRGDFDAAMAIVRELSSDARLYILNSINPFRLEGQKTIVFETLQQLDWEPPDWIVVPGGNLGNTSAFGKAIDEMHELGIISRRPRLAVIQAAGANPFYQAFRSDFRDPPVVLAATTVATAIRIGAPVNYSKARRAVLGTAGVVEQVTDDEIMDAKAQVDAAGIGCEPASAAAVAGARKLALAGVIHPGDSVVAVLTGNLLKDSDATIAYHCGGSGLRAAFSNPPIEIEPLMAEVARLL